MSFDPSKYGKSSLKQNDVKGVSGSYIMKIKNCYVESPEDGSYTRVTMVASPQRRLSGTFVQLDKKPEILTDVVKIDKQLFKASVTEMDMPDKDKEYKFVFYVQRQGKDQYQAKVFTTSFYLTNENPKFSVKDKKVAVWDFDSNSFAEKPMPSYVELIDKEIGVMLKFSRMFPSMYVDGYTGEMLFDRQEISSNDNAVRVKNYSADKSLSFDVLHFFDPKTYQTFTEREDAGAARVAIAYIKTAVDVDEEKLEESKQIDARKDALIKSLTKKRQKFNPALFHGAEANFEFGGNHHEPEADFADFSDDDL